MQYHLILHYRTSEKGVGQSVPQQEGQSVPQRAAGALQKKARAKRSLTRPQEDVPLARLHEEYLRARRIGGIRDTTLRMYESSLRPWETWCRARGVTLVGQILTKHAEDYLLTPLDRKLSERTIRNQAIVIKAALKFAYRQGYLPSERLYDRKIPRSSRASVYQ